MWKKVRRGRKGWRDHILEILSLWIDEECELTFSEIHKKLVELSIVPSIDRRSNTAEILKGLIEDGYIEKVDGKYRLKINPQSLNILNILKELYNKYSPDRTYSWRVGGSFWTLAEGTIIGLPKNIDENPFIREVLNVLIMRLSSIFSALSEIALLIGFAEKKGFDMKSIPLPKEAVREYLLEILPYILGERAGIDSDGLPTDDLIELTDQICRDLPNEFRTQPTDKQILLKYMQIARLLYAKAQDFDEFEEFRTLYELRDSRAKEIAKDYEKVVLIVHPPLYTLNREQYDNVELYNCLKEYIEIGISNALIVERLSYYPENIVRKALELLIAQSYISKERAIKILELYSLKKAGEALDYILSEYLSLMNKKDKPKAKSLEKVKELFYEAKQNHSLINMIRGVWLSNEHSNRLPSFIFFNAKDEEPISFVINTIQNFLLNIDEQVPADLEKIVKEGYNQATEVWESRKADRQKLTTH